MFFFSSRRRHTRFDCDWSSDVCSSDLEVGHDFVAGMLRDSMGKEGMKFFPLVFTLFIFIFVSNMLGMIPGAFTVTSHIVVTRSEERRVGKECRSRWSRYH